MQSLCAPWIRLAAACSSRSNGARFFSPKLRGASCGRLAHGCAGAEMDQAKNARALKRITKELEQLQGAQALPFAKVELKEKTELLIWKVTLQGPAGSPYEKGAFVTEIDLRGGYPFKHPAVLFTTKIFHPNVNRETGEICEELLGKNWSPETQMKEVLNKVYTMLATPDADAPVDEEITRMFKENPKKYKDEAAAWTKKHAMAKK